MSSNITYKSLTQLADLLENKETTSEEICSEYFDRIEKVEPQINAFIKLDTEDITKKAEESDSRRKAGRQLSRYDGIPISIKDIYNVKGQSCNCASKILAPYTAIYDATVIKKIKEKGFIPFGRNNMDEFAMGSSCENSSYQTTSNPWDLRRVPGGSSGGSAAAVSAGEVPASLGTDTGGSVRQPAAFCGIVGLKPSYGKVSRYGIVAFASSLDQAGPLSRNVLDSAVLLDTISGLDKMDTTTVRDKRDDSHESIVRKSNENLDGFKIGVCHKYLEMDGLSESIKENYMYSIEQMRELGAEIIDISFPYTKYAIAAYYIIATAEASANLARFDGIRYGSRIKDYKDLNELYLKTRGRKLGDEVKRRILLGTFVLSSGYYDAYYLRAQKVRTLISDSFRETFQKCDVFLSPTTPTPAFKIGEVSSPVEMYMADVFTNFVNLAGICGINIPSGLTKDDNLPVGLQILGPHLGEDKILKAAKVFEDNREIKEFIPDL
ncbi:MAG: Asp-tRNA(Asn)/Glu-tRNA(Gln) amidotransferase subunit GatA [Victivallales bacterium]|nr:Asp-tRNA(Asn)/Glu-tRNA(Gln) amidotransferase subunit GatA [Victivallales bacterium]MCF7888762.1 Asp-tRNA(Asn)/Glu-tRNA(Gln) amidotransferase subunit GatA [Victivallales bacterium]